ncbi:FUSC family protein [Natranaerofaba carboxydovora]|uniref:FUSC family protein n=1 Tax=Natranaerofaba carboxydovora TaxID=2742683 RepID=UPI001F13301D|nr:aromatic acid exporter family protein [Natranaerofaba carboxydovora]UMZ73344.1 Aromatic acid exporter family member 1 [Natranaerofaba carboxydovora]
MHFNLNINNNPMIIGPRVWKTGLAVAITFWITELLALDYSFLAVIAAIISVQPTISDSFKKGWERVLATAVGVIVAFTMILIFGSGPLSMGVGVIIGILVCKYFNWYESIVLASITIVILMSGYHEDNLFDYALYRTGLPFLGIGVAIFINLLFSPPKHISTLKESLKSLNESIESLFMRVINGFVTSKNYNEKEVEKLVLKVEEQHSICREILTRHKSELGYQKYFKGQDPESIKKYEKAIDLLWLIAQRVIDIHSLTSERTKRMGELDNNSFSSEYSELLLSVQEFLYLTNSFQRNLLQSFLNEEENYEDIISRQYSEIKELRAELRNNINKWQESHLGSNYIKSLMEIATLIYDLDQICNYLFQFMELDKDNHEESN